MQSKHAFADAIKNAAKSLHSPNLAVPQMVLTIAANTVFTAAVKKIPAVEKTLKQIDRTLQNTPVLAQMFVSSLFNSGKFALYAAHLGPVGIAVGATAGFVGQAAIETYKQRVNLYRAYYSSAINAYAKELEKSLDKNPEAANIELDKLIQEINKFEKVSNQEVADIQKQMKTLRKDYHDYLSISTGQGLGAAAAQTQSAKKKEEFEKHKALFEYQYLIAKQKMEDKIDLLEKLSEIPSLGNNQKEKIESKMKEARENLISFENANEELIQRFNKKPRNISSKQAMEVLSKPNTLFSFAFNEKRSQTNAQEVTLTIKK